MIQHLCLTARLKMNCRPEQLFNKKQQEKKSTYILIGGLVERDQVGMEASQSHH